MAKTPPKKTTKAKATSQPGREAKKAGKVVKPAARPAPVAKSGSGSKSISASSAKPAASKPFVSKPAVSKTTTKSKAAAPVAARRPEKNGKLERVGSGVTPVTPNHVAPTPSANAKPGKNQAGLGKKDLETFRELLLAKRRELLGDVHSMEQEALRSAGGSNLSNLPLHMADMGTDNYEQEFTLGLVEKDRQLLREINTALAKIADGRYGICEGTGKPISRARLEAQPWAKFSIEHARQMEKGYGYMRGAI